MLRNNKGFTLVEILVTVGLVAILSTIAIPAYKNYRTNAFKTVIKADASTGYKMYLTYYTIDGSYCGSLATVGLNSLEQSENYSTGKGFFGFVDAAGCSDVANDDAQYKSGAGITASSCKLTGESFDLGVASDITSDHIIGYFVSEDNSAPIERSSAYCEYASNVAAVDPKCQDKKGCEDANNKCKGGTAKGTWIAGSTIPDLCKAKN